MNVLTTQNRIDSESFEEFCQNLLAGHFGAGLLVSGHISPFRFRLLQKSANCWVPAVSWGRQHVRDIASLNRLELGDVIPYKDYVPRGGSLDLGAGSVLWSDIIEFKEIGFQLGEKLALNPTKSRRIILAEISRCFDRAGSRGSTHAQKVGADGWFHFYETSSSENAMHLGIATQQQIHTMALTPRYSGVTMKVVMGANMVGTCAVDIGGPLDDDSIIAYELITRPKHQYDLRATEEAVVNLAPASTSKSWLSFDNFTYAHRKRINVFGYTDWP